MQDAGSDPRRSALDRLSLRDMSPARRARVLLAGVALVCGLLVLPWPGTTPRFLAGVLGAWALLSGGVCVAVALRNRAEFPGWRMLLALGVACFAIALAAAFWRHSLS